GDRFLSNRAVATQYGISYQTAQRLLSALVSDGLLVRRAGSGTYLPGGEGKLCGVDLLFNTRAKRRGSFGAKLLSLMRGKLQRLGVETSVRLIDPTAAPLLERPLGRLPVIWDLPAVVQQAAEAARQAIVLNDRPAIGF